MTLYLQLKARNSNYAFFCHETNDNTLEKLIELPNQFWYWVFNKSQYVYWLLLTVKQLSSCTLNQLLLFCLICFEVFMGLISFFICRSLKLSIDRKDWKHNVWISIYPHITLILYMHSQPITPIRVISLLLCTNY